MAVSGKEAEILHAFSSNKFLVKPGSSEQGAVLARTEVAHRRQVNLSIFALYIYAKHHANSVKQIAKRSLQKDKERGKKYNP